MKTPLAASPAYRRIAAVLRAGIADGVLPPGSVLLEQPLARHFATSRVPVRQALALLEDAGEVRRFDGRGLVVPGGAVSASASASGRRRADLSRLAAASPAPDRDALYYGVERLLVLHSLHGAARINELGLARALGIGRALTRELLLTAARTGLVARDPDGRGGWQLQALGPQRLDDLYALRELLEPVAVASVAAPPDLLARMLADLDRAAGQSDPAPALLDALETDLHVTLLTHAANPELAGALLRARPVLIAGKHMQRTLLRPPDSFTDEHAAVLCALAQGDAPRAAARMRSHIALSRQKALDRLAAYLALPRDDARPDWLQPSFQV